MKVALDASTADSVECRACRMLSMGLQAGLSAYFFFNAYKQPRHRTIYGSLGVGIGLLSIGTLFIPRTPKATGRALKGGKEDDK